MSGVEFEFSVEDGESGTQEDDGGTETEAGDSRTQASSTNTRGPSRIQGKWHCGFGKQAINLQ